MYLNILGLDLASIDKPTIVIVLAGQVIVVVVLFFLYKLFTFVFPSVIKSVRKQKTADEFTVSEKKNSASAEEDVNAAIAMALYLHFNEIHDEESNVITIQRVSKTYSPWSSKLYNMRNFR
jgi:Na+-transporting methylmalonyl-CoA/oxaloacetate decarboxylase gamma subunit